MFSACSTYRRRKVRQIPQGLVGNPTSALARFDRGFVPRVVVKNQDDLDYLAKSFIDPKSKAAS